MWNKVPVKLASKQSTVLLTRDGCVCVQMYELVCKTCGYVVHYDGLKDGYFVKNNGRVADLKSKMKLSGLLTLAPPLYP